MHDFTFGSDPEFMLTDSEGNLRSAIAIVKGTSDDRIEVGGHAFYHDNVNIEMAIAPSVGKMEVLSHFREAFKTAAEMIHPFKMVPRASADFPASELEDPEAKVIGCNAEYCAYELKELTKPVEEFESSTFRSAGGHVHLGADEGALRDEYGFFFIVRCLDLFLGVPSLFMDHDPTSRRRKELYGLAGSHRWKPYGVEYRALGNFWLASPKVVETVLDICEFTIDFCDKDKHLQFWKINHKKIDKGEEVAECITPTNYDQDELRAALNTANKTTAKKFLTLAESYMPKGLVTDIKTHFTPVNYDFYKEWTL
jgi:hypothetical protein